MKSYQPAAPLTRRQFSEPDQSLRATVADLLDALDVTRRERDQALAKLRQAEQRADSYWAHMGRTHRWLSTVAKSKRRRRMPVEGGQLELLLP